MTTDVRSPGGWLTLLNTRISRALVVGALAVTGGGGVATVYGLFQGAQAEQYCEFSVPTATTDSVAVYCLNPLPNGMTGAILPDAQSIVYVNEVPSPVTRLNIGTATGASVAIKGTATLANVASGIVLSTAKELFTLANTGALTAHNAAGITPVLLAPRDSTGRRYLNFTWTRGGTGLTSSGEAPVLVRIKIVPCNLEGVGC